jgi:fibronectin-binding autotransporter adhesin
MKPNSPICLILAGSSRLAVALAVLFAAQAAHATSATWFGTDSSLWATSNNWSGAPAVVPGSGNTATFSLDAATVNSNTVIDLGAGVTIQQVAFDTANAAAYTIGSGGVGTQALTFNAGGINLDSSVANDQSVAANVIVGTANGNQTFTFTNNSAANSLTLAGGISSVTTGTKTLTINGAGNIGISGAMTQGSGTFALNKSGAGVLTLSGPNAFSGTTNVAVGSTIRSGTDNVLADASMLQVSAGTIDLNGFDDTVSGSGGKAINFYTTGGAYNLTNTVATGTGTLTLGGDINVDSDARTTVNLISGKLDLGSATRTVSNASYGGIGHTAQMTPVHISADISGGAGAGIISSNNGVAAMLRLSGNNSYTGPTTLNNGYLQADHANALGNGGDISFTGSGGILQYTANSAGTDWSTRFKGSSKPVKLDTNGQAVTLAGIIDNSNNQGLTKLGSGTLTLSGANTYPGNTTVNAGTLRSGADDVLPNASGVYVSGNGAGVTATLDLNGHNDTIGSITFGGATPTSGAGLITGAGTLTLSGNVVYDSSFGPLGATLAGNLDLGGATRTFTVNDSATTTVDLTVSAAISGTGAGLTKNGAGTLVLAGLNSYDGNMTVNSGLLQFNAADSIAGSGRNITVNGGGAVALGYVPATTIQDDLLSRIVSTSTGAVALTANTAENFDFSSGGPNDFTALSLGADGNVTYSGTLTRNGTIYRLGGGGGTLTMANTNALVGANSLVVSGKVILAGNNSVSGSTTINANSTLTLDAGISGVGSTSIVNNGTLIVNNAAAQSFGGVVSDGGALIKNGGGSLTLSTPQTYSGTTTINAGSLILDGGDHTLNVNKTLVVNGGTLDLGSNKQYVGNFGGSGGTISGSGTLTTNPTSIQTFAGTIVGSVNLVKVGNGSGRILTLTGDSTSTGSISVIGGDQPQTQGPSYGGMKLVDGGRLSGTGAIDLANGSLFIDNTGTVNDNDRVNDTAAITLDSGRIIYTGRASTASAESLGDVTASRGMGTITATAGGSGSAEVTLSSLTRTTGATLRVDGSNLGTAGNSSRILVTAALAGNLAGVNGVIPGVFKGTGGGTNSPVGYVAGLGFAAVGTVGGFPATYGGPLDAATATDNVVGASAWAVLSGGQTINSLVQTGNLTFADAADTLTIESGMICQNAQSSPLIGTSSVRGRLTSGLGTGELFLIRTNEGSGGAAGALQVSSVIVDNGGTRVKLVLDSYQRTNLTNQLFNLTASNTYTGGTVVSGGNETYLNSAGTAIPAAFDPSQGLVINDSVVTMQGNAQQIAASNIVSLNGGSVLNFIGANNILAGIVFNSNGGKGQNPTIQGGSKLTLTGNITSNPSDVSVTPTINLTLDLNGSTAHDITVAALPEGAIVNTETQLNGLTISAVIQNGGFTKKGAGVLNLTATNTYAGNTIVKEGILCVTKAYLADSSAVRIGTAPGDNAVLKLNHNLTDTVNQLFIDGVQMPAGTYGSTSSAATNKDDSAFAGTGVLDVLIGTAVTDPFELWAQANITDINPGADATPGGNPDDDGANNLAEFAFNGDPLNGADQGKVYVLTADSEDVGTSKELILTVAVRADTPAFSGDPSPTATSAVDDITYTIEGSTTLGSFVHKVNILTTALPPAVDPTPGSGYVYRSFSLDGSDGLTGKGFLRAKIMRP